MNDSQKTPQTKRQYSPFWEKAVPIFLVILGIAVIALLVIVFVVLTGSGGL